MSAFNNKILPRKIAQANDNYDNDNNNTAAPAPAVTKR